MEEMEFINKMENKKVVKFLEYLKAKYHSNVSMNDEIDKFIKEVKK